jgi:hypothetical protein
LIYHVFAVFGNLISYVFRVGLGMFQIAAYLIFLPAIVLMMIFGGPFYVALPILIIAGIVGMAERTERVREKDEFADT